MRQYRHECFGTSPPVYLLPRKAHRWTRCGRLINTIPVAENDIQRHIFAKGRDCKFIGVMPEMGAGFRARTSATCSVA